MDNNNNNRPESFDDLSAQNRKWLEDLLNGTAEPAPAEPEKPAVAEPEEPVATEPEEPEVPPEVQPAEAVETNDEELEKILAEDWSSVPDPEELPEDVEVSAEESEEVAAPVAEEVPIITRRRAKKTVEKKSRPKRKDGYGLLGIPHILSTVIWLALILAIGISLGRLLWVCCADVMAFGKEPQKVTITITEDDTIKTVAQKLGHANLVRYPGLFEFFAKVTGKDDNISPGTFTLNSQLDYNAMINAMVYYGSSREVVDIMFPEGVNCAQIFMMLEDKNVCTVAELEEYAANGELKEYWFLEGVARGDKYCLEGYLAPDTYKFYTGDEPRRVLEKFLNEFEDRFTDKMKTSFETIKKQYAANLRANGFGSSYINEHTLTLHQIITLASVIQKETSSDSECYDIASVFYNRLVNPSIQSLGADATVYYALGDYFGEIDELTAEHLNVDSPYNTRKYKGIPPGPICNMGVQALYAALQPNDTNYHYFVYDKEKGAHRFAVTQREHLQNVNELMG